MRQVFQSKNINNEEINLAKILDLFRKRWYFIVVSFVLAAIGCKLYLRYTKPVYMAEATVRVEDSQHGGQSMGLLDGFGFGMMRDDIQSEIQLVQSRTIIASAINKMQFKCLYYLVGTLVTSEIYKDDAPFVVEYDSLSQVPYHNRFSFYYLSGNKFKLAHQIGPERIENQYYFGENIDIDGFKFKIYKRETPRYKLTPEVEFQWEAIQWEAMVGRAMAGLKVEQSGYLVPILKISMQDNVAKFSSEFLNTLIEVYELQDSTRKTLGANQALQFIQDQINRVGQSVNEAEFAIEKFKQDREFFNVDLKASFDIENLKQQEVSRNEMLVRKLEIERLEKEVKSGEAIKTFSYSIAEFSDPLLGSIIASYNSATVDIALASQIYTDEHPKILDLKAKQEDLRQSILTNIESIRQGNENKLAYFTRLLQVAKDSLERLPETERVMQSLMREYKVKEEILLTLLQKQAEAKISTASIVSSVQIMDKALLPIHPISPNPRKTYIIGCGLGICLGLLLIIIAGMLKNTVSYREEIESMSFTPIIGVVRRANESVNQKYPRMLSIENPKSGLSESFRGIRTNLQFLAADKSTKVVAITSTVSGEGKSFITINLAGMLSILGIKVVIIDMDLRKPKLHYSFGSDNSVGLSTLLVGKSTFQETLRKTEYENLDLITSGPIPPNPSELILSTAMANLLEDLKTKYDYIMIDTPPIGLVTDGTSTLISADVALYVVRADFSKRAFLKHPDQLAEEHNIRNLYIVFNSVSTVNKRYGGYGYKVYGHGYYSEDHKEPKWWEVWKRFGRKK
jgi:tyrosine-protein kinase Etk/Wzc